MSLNSASKPLDSAFVKMCVADTSATPSATAIAVRIRRRGLCRTFLRARRSMRSVAHLLHAVENALCGRLSHLVDNDPVLEEQNAIRIRGCGWVVGDHDDG